MYCFEFAVMTLSQLLQSFNFPFCQNYCGMLELVWHLKVKERVGGFNSYYRPEKEEFMLQFSFRSQ